MKWSLIDMRDGTEVHWFGHEEMPMVGDLIETGGDLYRVIQRQFVDRELYDPHWNLTVKWEGKIV